MPEWLRKKVSEAKKGKPNFALQGRPSWRKGRPLSERHKRKIGLANTGKVRSEMLKRHLSRVMIGRTLSEEHKRKLKENSARYWLGKKRGPQNSEWIKKRAEALKGHRVSTKTVRRVSKLHKGKFGKEHPCWKEIKKNPLYKAIRQSGKTDVWRLEIFKRDKFACVICGSKISIQANHYPKSFAEILNKYNIQTYEKALSCKTLWNINNGRTLCLECHKKTPNYLRKPTSLSVK